MRRFGSEIDDLKRVAYDNYDELKQRTSGVEKLREENKFLKGEISRISQSNH